ncbi:MAG TPA: type II secretion system protein GspG [Halieaceae bacterium]|uniref:type II secretion system major pseudopilin GspG n=1 Tax=Haliea TaxID=475794 RepID=UPI000C66CB8D|nr:type II secretion system major pseudopilin GspG [Haliea sp.]HAN69408.1 type II secretion system protein GspG [Halieaceae bacterium]MAD64798.1 type II secretion system protein GspG [Haliea sp.]MAY94304.1 type II secretion system protein GspG [Haliea sp.]MBP70998.1 type II secretion system protein GspG [Haliea sp.]HBM82037.1 type II secretion system protein GspG [Halieaceae bacterium]
MTHFSRRSDRGFTLVELLVVLAILALLAGLVGPQVLNQLGGAKSKTAGVQIRDLEQALEMYKLDLGRFPPTDAGLEALVREPAGAKGWNGPYLRGTSVPDDPWGNAYNYRFPGQHTAYDLFSYGADAAPGGSGENADVTNWE